MSEPVTPATPEEHQQELDFELVTRKRKGKRKGKMSYSTFRNKNENPQHSSEFDRHVENESRNFDNVNVIIGRPITSEELEEFEAKSRTASRVTLDGRMKSPPQISVIYPEDEARFKEVSPSDEATPTFEEKSVQPPKVIQETGVSSKEIERINTRALPRTAATYQLEKFEKNILLIFNQVHVDGYKPRLGTEKDVEALRNTFENFGFEVQVEEDLRKDDVMAKLEDFTSQDFTHYGCVAIAVLTHGSKDGRIRAKDMSYSEMKIINQLQVHDKPTLITKPRMVIIQACRGDKEIRGVPVASPYSARIQKDSSEEIEPYTLPVEADMLVLHSSYVGKPSHRDEVEGSWFIQSLCRKINQLSSSHDFESILTEVKREVAIDREHVEHNRRTDEDDINKQMPVLTSTLIRKLYLKKFGDAESTLQASENVEQTNSHNVLDNAVPNTPLLVQFGPCSCFLEHFTYIKNCLSYFVADNPEDAVAKAFLNVASTFEEGVHFNSSKEEMAKAISTHLRDNGRNFTYYKYLYFYKH